MPLYRTEVWLGDKWLAKSVGWKPEETEAHAIELAHERINREGLKSAKSTGSSATS
jgi:hypothetical protein